MAGDEAGDIYYQLKVMDVGGAHFPNLARSHQPSSHTLSSDQSFHPSKYLQGT